jgi:UDP-N-acetylmuramyl pentapeptide synthase
VKIYSHTFPIKTALLGKHSIQNILPVIGVANELGIAGGTMIRTLQKMDHVKHKLSLHKGPQGSVILSDAGNSNVNGFMEALDVASQFPQDVKIVVTKGIIELGKEKDTSYKTIIEEAKKRDIQIYTTDSLFAAFNSELCLYFYDEFLLLDSLQSILDTDTLIVIEGKFNPLFVKGLIK